MWCGMSKLEKLQKYEADIYGRAERNGAKTAVELLGKLVAEAVKESREEIASLKHELSNYRNSCDNKIAELKHKLESKSDIPYLKTQECLDALMEAEGRTYCKNKNVELTASDIGEITIISSKGDVTFLRDCHIAIAEQNAEYVFCPQHDEL